MYYRLYFIFCQADSSTFVGMRVGKTINKTYDVDLRRSREYFFEQNKTKKYFKKMCKKLDEYPSVYFKIHFDDYISKNKEDVLNRLQLAQERLGSFLLNDSVFDNTKEKCELCDMMIRKKIINKHKLNFCKNRKSTCQEIAESPL